MRGRISGFLLYIGSAVAFYWKDWIWEFFRSWGFEWAHHTLEPYISEITLQRIVEYGPPTSLALIGTLLFWLTRPRRTGVPSAAAGRTGRPAEAAAEAADKGENSLSSQLPTWFELEQRFRELEPALQFSRIDGQTGAAGEFWRIAGTAGQDVETRFNAVAAMASARLLQDFPGEFERHKELASESDSSIRWYKALRYVGNRYKQSDFIVRETNDDGSSGGFIFTGSIDKPAAASATLCLELASRAIRGSK